MSGWECPACGWYATKASDPASQRETPRPGDVFVCVACGEPGVFDQSAFGAPYVRVPSVIELAVIMGNERVTGVMAMVREARDLANGAGE